MKTMEDVKAWIRDRMAIQIEIAEGHEAAKRVNAAQVCRGRVDVLNELHTKLAIYFPKSVE